MFNCWYKDIQTNQTLVRQNIALMVEALQTSKDSKLIPVYTAQKPRRQPLSNSPP
jgi:hypothetical protein